MYRVLFTSSTCQLESTLMIMKKLTIQKMVDFDFYKDGVSRIDSYVENKSLHMPQVCMINLLLL
ncbi:hypothetical protein I7I53_01614 [Histoplasma capsulatum var. duboisii H88]|uniref:Uncharacterized protein n=1 Tax=Ajellomyces capsulatus (strain H88) TaxID=544711 RepID=A0A8A1LJL4_AJEC8|nr:hypothetical protein I7I53_01614 [Histoplasma capsulatum var. duboisii H88]